MPAGAFVSIPSIHLYRIRQILLQSLVFLYFALKAAWGGSEKDPPRTALTVEMSSVCAFFNNCAHPNLSSTFIIYVFRRAGELISKEIVTRHFPG